MVLSDVYAATDSGIFRHDGSKWQREKTPAIDQNTTISDVWGLSATDVFAVGTSGVILRKCTP